MVQYIVEISIKSDTSKVYFENILNEKSFTLSIVPSYTIILYTKPVNIILALYMLCTYLYTGLSKLRPNVARHIMCQF